MRVLVLTDAIGALSSQQAGEVLGSGWSGDSVRVVPAGVSGGGFLAAYADAHEVPIRRVGPARLAVTGEQAAVAVVGGPGETSADGSSRPIGEAIAQVRAQFPGASRIVVDLGGLGVHDGGAGMLAALGAQADVPLDQGVDALRPVGQLDLAPARDLIAGVELIAVVPAAEQPQLLLGLRGITSLRGRAEGWDVELMLATDLALQRFAGLLAAELAKAPGAGACGGVGFGVLALGGSLTTGPALALAAVEPRGWDLVVTGCSVFDFATRGGGVVAAAAEWAAAALCPCIAIAGEAVVGSREMRTMGIEAAYPVRASHLDAPEGAVSEAELRATARRVARSWRW